VTVGQVRVQDLSYIYPDGQRALGGVSFQVGAGESVGVVGSNGAGKSTLLMHLNGVLLAPPGTVSVSGIALTRQTLAQVRQRAGLVMQDADDQLFMPTVLDDVAFGPRQQGLIEAEVLQRATDAMTTVATGHLAQRATHALSGGEKRRVALAGVLAMQPEVLVLDEPSAGLDPRARRQLIELLSGLKLTRILASHDLDLVLDVCTRVLVLREGELVADGPAQDILCDEDLMARCHLELPLSRPRRSPTG